MLGIFSRQLLSWWLLGYALVGMVVSGIVPILIPLSVEPKGPLAVGAVVAAFYLGMLAAPLFGSLADRTDHRRLTFLAAFPVMAAAAATFGVLDHTAGRFGCMLVCGAAAGAAQTVAAMFIVEGRPHNEWRERIGWLRLAFGIGQTVGLAVAAMFTRDLGIGWLVAAGLVLGGTVLGSIGLPKVEDSPADPVAVPVDIDGAEHPRLAALRRTFAGEFGVFLGCWLFAMIGLMSFYNVVPLILSDGFAIDPADTSLIFLAGAAVGALCYPVSGRLCERIGPAWVLAAGLTVTAAAFAAMAIVGGLHSASATPVGGACLVIVAVAYPLQYVGATVLAAEITRGGEGAAMGLFNSCVAAGAIAGAIVPSFLARAAGYAALPYFSLGACLIAVCLGIPVLRRHGRGLRTYRPVAG